MSVDARRPPVGNMIGAIAREGLLIGLIALVALPALAVGAADGFTDPQGRFAFDLPDNWQRDDTVASPGLIVQYATADPDGAFSVTAAPLPEGVTIDMVPGLVGARLQAQYPDFQKTDLAPTSVAGEPGAELDYTATGPEGQLLAVAQTLVAHNGTLYLLTVAAKPEALDAGRRAAAPILASWRWLA